MKVKTTMTDDDNKPEVDIQARLAQYQEQLQNVLLEIDVLNERLAAWNQHLKRKNQKLPK